MNRRDKSGFGSPVVSGIIAYVLWGLIPLYFKTVAEVGSAEVLAHRALWSFVVLVVVVRLLGRWREVQDGWHLLCRRNDRCRSRSISSAVKSM